jgi:hypothetical protein
MRPSVLTILVGNTAYSGAEEFNDVLEEKWRRKSRGGNEHDTQCMGRYMMINTAEMYCDMRTGRRELILGLRAQRSHRATPQSA